MSTAVKGDKETVGKSAGKPGADGKPITRPQNGSEYLDSLRDDRTIYIYGERVKDVTTRQTRTVAGLDDALDVTVVDFDTEVRVAGFSQAEFARSHACFAVRYRFTPPLVGESERWFLTVRIRRCHLRPAQVMP